MSMSGLHGTEDNEHPEREQERLLYEHKKMLELIKRIATGDNLYPTRACNRFLTYHNLRETGHNDSKD